MAIENNLFKIAEITSSVAVIICSAWIIITRDIFVGFIFLIAGALFIYLIKQLDHELYIDKRFRGYISP